MSGKHLVTPQKSSKPLSNDYSKILDSFNKRFSDLYSFQNQNLAQKPEQIYSESISLSTETEPVNQQKQGLQINLHPQEQFQKLQYKQISTFDPYLIKVSNQLEQKYNKQKETLMKLNFTQRYQKLIDTQKHFQLYKQEKQSEITQLSEKIINSLQENQNLTSKAKQFENKVKQLQIKLEETERNNEIQLEKIRQVYESQKMNQNLAILELVTTISKKDKEIQSLQKTTIYQLELSLDEQVTEGLELKKQIECKLKEIVHLNEQINSVDRKHLELIQTLQKSLNQCEEEKVVLSEDFERVSEELHNLKQKNMALKYQIKQLQVENQGKIKDLQKLTDETQMEKQKTQNEMYEHKTRYLQEVKEKNSIIEQYEDTKQRMKEIQGKLEELSSQSRRMQDKLREVQKELKTERARYAQTCGQYESEISLLKQNLQSHITKYQDTSNLLEIKTKSYDDTVLNLTKEKAQLQSRLKQNQQIICTFQKECLELKNFKNSSLEETKNSKACFLAITDELKRQLSKAKQIVTSKNQQINQLRGQSHHLREQLRQSKGEICALENQINQLRYQFDSEKIQIKYELEKANEELKVVKMQKIQEMIKRDEQIQELNEQLKGLKRILSEKQVEIGYLNLEVESLKKEISLLKVQKQDLQNEVSAKQKQIELGKKQAEKQNIELNATHNEQKQSITENMQLQLLKVISGYEQTLKLKEQEMVEAKTKALQDEKQIQKLTGLLIQVTREKEKAERDKHVVEEKLLENSQKLKFIQKQKEILQEKYQKEHEVVLLQIQQRNFELSGQKNTLFKQFDQNKGCNHRRNQSVQTNEEKKSAYKQIEKENPLKELEQKYIRVIEKMKLETMELALCFKEKSAQEQQLRKMLETQNQTISNKLNHLTLKYGHSL